MRSVGPAVGMSKTLGAVVTVVKTVGTICQLSPAFVHDALVCLDSCHDDPHHSGRAWVPTTNQRTGWEVGQANP